MSLRGVEHLRRGKHFIDGVANVPSVAVSYVLTLLVGMLTGCVEEQWWADSFPAWLYTTAPGDTIYAMSVKSRRCLRVLSLQRIIQAGLVVVLAVVTPASPTGLEIALPVAAVLLSFHAVPSTRTARRLQEATRTGSLPKRVLLAPVAYVWTILSGNRLGHFIFAMGVLYAVHQWSLALFLLLLYILARVGLDGLHLLLAVYRRRKTADEWVCQHCSEPMSTARAVCPRCGSYSLHPGHDDGYTPTRETLRAFVLTVGAMGFGIVAVLALSTSGLYIADGTFTKTTVEDAVTGPAYGKGLQMDVLANETHSAVNDYRSEHNFTRLERKRAVDQVAHQLAQEWHQTGQFPSHGELTSAVNQTDVRCPVPAAFGTRFPHEAGRDQLQQQYLNESQYAQTVVAGQLWNGSASKPLTYGQYGGAAALLTSNGTVYVVEITCKQSATHR